MKKSNLIKSLLTAASLPLLAGCVVYEQQPAAVAAPPPAQTEVVPVAPGPPDVWFWIPGEWVWRGQWVWVGGRWGARPHPGAVWVHGGWGWRGHHRVWVEAHWR
ncbi:MAG: hypothetical protein WBS33_03385 [Verrucomicrobiia bacterium]